jgi:protein tyrosine/serine phosphatase
MPFKKHSKIIAIWLALFFFYFGCYSIDNNSAKNKTRPGNWAVSIQREGLPNLFKVSETLYRGAQPTKIGVEELKKMGIKTVINFRETESDYVILLHSSITYYHLPMNAFFPSKEKYKRFLEIVSDPKNLPAFVHCRHGADRTGAAIALYRIKIQKWDPEEAIKEMINGGFGFHKIHNHLKRFVRKF